MTVEQDNKTSLRIIINDLTNLVSTMSPDHLESSLANELIENVRKQAQIDNRLSANITLQDEIERIVQEVNSYVSKQSDLIREINQLAIRIHNTARRAS